VCGLGSTYAHVGGVIYQGYNERVILVDLVLDSHRHATTALRRAVMHRAIMRDDAFIGT
jgi:hypothetical protein